MTIKLAKHKTIIANQIIKEAILQKKAQTKTAQHLNSLSSIEIKKKRMAEKSNYIDIVKKEAIGDLISNLIWIIVALFFFITHRQKKKN